MAIAYMPRSLSGLYIVLTGRTFGLSRIEVMKAIRDAGGVVQDAVDATTQLVVATNPSRRTTKQQEALRRNIPIVSDADFANMLKGNIDARAWINRNGQPATSTPATPAPSVPVSKTETKPSVFKALAKIAPSDDPFGAAF